MLAGFIAAPVYAANLLSTPKFDFEPEGDDRKSFAQTNAQHDSRAVAAIGRRFHPTQSLAPSWVWSDHKCEFNGACVHVELPVSGQRQQHVVCVHTAAQA